MWASGPSLQLWATNNDQRAGSQSRRILPIVVNRHKFPSRCIFSHYIPFLAAYHLRQSGHDALIGAEGNDRLTGGGGRDLLLGGDNTDRMAGGAGDDLLIGGRTIYDMDLHLLFLIHQKWKSGLTYSARVNDLLSGNGVPQLSAAQVVDAFYDELYGDADLEFFFFSLGDLLTGRAAAEKSVKVS